MRVLLKHLTAISLIVLLLVTNAVAQTIGNFSSVTPAAQSQSLVIPSTHTFQRLIKTGDALTLGGTLGADLDFTGYVPIAGSSRNGYLSISSESGTAGVAILNISYNVTTDRWVINSSGNVAFPASDIGTVSRFCSGTVTPNNTIMVSEEDVTTGDVNSDGYTDRGWIIEINPATRTVINQDGTGGVDKLWAMGRTNRENVVIRSDNAVLYMGADDASFGYLYKFVPTIPGNFSSGNLYVLQTTSSLGNGTWRAVANNTVANRNNTRNLSQTAGGYNFNGIEDVEIGPDGRIYFTAKAEGKVYRFTDNGTYGTATDVSGLSVFVGNDAFPTIRSYDVDGPGPLGAEAWSTGNDNLAFDGEGNLWVLQDGGRNHIWVVGPTHTQASPQVRLFGRTPAGSEPTGITFTPDYKFMFISIQHPNGGNSTSQLDATNTPVIFNTHTTMVISRIENLGPFSTLPVTFTKFDVKQHQDDKVDINWAVEEISNHQYFSIERSVDGINFIEIARNTENINGLHRKAFTVTDYDLPFDATTLYYRIRQCDLDHRCKYTETKSVRITHTNRIKQIYPQPAMNQINVVYNSFTEGNSLIYITDIHGNRVQSENRRMTRGIQTIIVDTEKLSSAVYLLTITDITGKAVSQKFVKH